MAKGPKPKGEYTGKSSVFSTRIRPDLRERLESATAESGRSLSQEVEYRLRRSFVEDDKISDGFGDRRTFRLMRLMAEAINLSTDGENKPGAWLENPLDFRIALSAALSVLEAVEPNGSALDDDLEINAAYLGAGAALTIWNDVRRAKASIGLNEGALADHINAVAKADIGAELMSRVERVSTALAFRRYAEAAARVFNDRADSVMQDIQQEQLEDEDRERGDKP